MRILRVRRLAALVVLPFLVSAAQAQASRGPYYQRTTTPGFTTPRGAARVASPTIAPGGMDRLQPYTQTSAGAGAGAAAAPFANTYSSHPRVPPPRVPPPPPPTSRNYYPTARFGQGPNRNIGDHCTPSRGGMIFGLR